MGRTTNKQSCIGVDTCRRRRYWSWHVFFSTLAQFMLGAIGMISLVVVIAEAVYR